jgi:hypothetical protein
MSTNSPTNRAADLEDPALREADAAAILEQLVSGRRLDPAIVERVHGRAAQVTDGIRRVRGLLDDETFQSLLDDEA